jgi:nucleotide-binding universal stress UspA family protein
MPPDPGAASRQEGVMIAIARILCPVDLSDFSRRALAYALSLGRWYGAPVTALHVRPRAARPLFWGEEAPGPALESLLEGPAADEAVHALVREVAASVPVMVSFREGTVAAEIVKEAAETSADLIVIGTHGASGFERLMLGSVTEKVLRKAPCPVLTVPGGGAGEAHEPHVTFKTIVCGVDFSGASRCGLDYALSFAQEAGGRLVLAHAIENADVAYQPAVTMRFDAVEYVKALEADALQRMAALIPDPARVWCEPELAIGYGKPYLELLRIARERGADLVVLGTQGRGALDAMLFGSTAAHVVRAAPCPVLTVRLDRHAAARVA